MLLISLSNLLKYSKSELACNPSLPVILISNTLIVFMFFDYICKHLSIVENNITCDFATRTESD